MSLPVHIMSIPGIGEFDVGVSLEDPSEECSLQDDPQVDAA